ncbi:hypothetical protein, conserved [Eimeria praecox]|uniref:TNase-like domain-containing protein n=1 Tax=Eimeria praecox TaxID=51316 RepID=U6G765_9EIME|nr:hypothetical protein, conserved [Eimeria praecox]
MEKEEPSGAFELPALRLAELLKSKGSEEQRANGTKEGEGKLKVAEPILHAALIAETVDGKTVKCVPLTALAGLESRLDDEEAKKVPPVIEALRVPSTTYVDLESFPQTKMGYIIRKGQDSETKRFQLAGVAVPKAQLGEELVAMNGPLPSDRSYGSEHLDVGGEPLGVAAAASLADLVLGRVVLLQVLHTEEDGTWVGNILMPVACDSRVDGSENAEKLYRSLARMTLMRGKAFHELGKELEPPLDAWEFLEAVVEDFKVNKGHLACAEVLNCFRRAVFDYWSCPPLMAIVDVSDIMLQRGLAWTVGGIEDGQGILDPSTKMLNTHSWHRRMSLQERAKKARRGIWQLQRNVLHQLGVKEEEGLWRLTGAVSAFPALLLAQILEYLSGEELREGGDEGKSDIKTSKGERNARPYFAALVIRVVDGDTVRLMPVWSDEDVHNYMHRFDRCYLLKLQGALSKSTADIIGCQEYPRAVLHSWFEEEERLRCAGLDSRSILTQLYGIDAPEVQEGGLRPYSAVRYIPCKRDCAVYGSEDLDKGGQPLGIAAARAMADMVLGRVVLVQPLGSDRYERLVARILIPAVSDGLHTDGLHTGADSYAGYFDRLLEKLVYTFRYSFGISKDLPSEKGVYGVAAIVCKMREARKGDLRGFLLGCLRDMRVGSFAGIVDPCEEMLRRGLAIVYSSRRKKAEYGGILQEKKLKQLERRAKYRGCGRWGLPSFCQENPKDYRYRNRRNRSIMSDKEAKALDKREACRKILLGITGE